MQPVTWIATAEVSRRAGGAPPNRLGMARRFARIATARIPRLQARAKPLRRAGRNVRCRLGFPASFAIAFAVPSNAPANRCRRPGPEAVERAVFRLYAGSASQQKNLENPTIIPLTFRRRYATLWRPQQPPQHLVGRRVIAGFKGRSRPKTCGRKRDGEKTGTWKRAGTVPRAGEAPRVPTSDRVKRYTGDRVSSGDMGQR